MSPSALPVGLDLGHTAIRLVRLAEDGPPLVDRTDTPSGAIDDRGYVADRRALVEAVRELVERHGLRGERAVTAVPPRLLHTCRFPVGNRAEAAPRALQLLARELRYAPTEALVAVETLWENEEGQVVIASVSPRQVVEDLAAVLRQAGLEPAAIDSPAFAAADAVDAGEGRPLLVGCEPGEVTWTRLEEGEPEWVETWVGGDDEGGTFGAAVLEALTLSEPGYRSGGLAEDEDEDDDQEVILYGSAARLEDIDDIHTVTTCSARLAAPAALAGVEHPEAYVVALGLALRPRG